MLPNKPRRVPCFDDLRIATRYDEVVASHLAFVALATIRL